MKLSMFKIYHRYYISCIFLLLFLNVSIFLYFLRYQTQNVSFKDSKAIDNLQRRLSILINSSNKELKKHQELIDRFLDKLQSIETSPILAKESIIEEKVIKDNPKLTPKHATNIKEKAKSLLCNPDVSIPILVITCNRPEGLERTLTQLIKRRRESQKHIRKEQFPIYVSQGCQHAPTMAMVMKYKHELSETLYYKQSDSQVSKGLVNKRLIGYFKISDHYKIAMNWIFNTQYYKLNSTSNPSTSAKDKNMQIYKLGRSTQNADAPISLSISNSKLINYDAAIIVEDDLDISPDFFYYFLSSYGLLKKDDSLYCVSAWNDNGKSNLIDRYAYSAIYRTDFFPGLGWMLLRSLWLDVGPTWPNSFWDEYLRETKIRKGRQCIRPELPRTFTFGRKGVSNGQFYDKHLRFLMLNNQLYDFCNKKSNNQMYFYDTNNKTGDSSKPSSILQFPPDINVTLSDYKSNWFYIVYNYSRLYTVDNLLKLKENKAVNPNNTFINKVKNITMIPSPFFVRIEYQTEKELILISKKLSLMDDLKNKVPRTAFQNIVTCYIANYRIFLAPALNSPNPLKDSTKPNVKKNKFTTNHNISSPLPLTHSTTKHTSTNREQLKNNKIIKKPK